MEFPVNLFSIIFLILLFVPGFFFKRFYFLGEFTKQFGSGIFIERFITSIFWGIVIQLLTFLLLRRVLSIDDELVFKSAGDFYSQLSSNILPGKVAIYKILTLYILCSLLIAIFLGFICHKLVRLLKLDIKINILRFANHWNYYFRGEILSTNEFKTLKRGKVISTEADIFVDCGEERPVLYSGFLTQYSISQKTGDLEYIFITNSHRYSKTKNGLKEIPGDLLVIPHHKIINLNLRYNIRKPQESKIKETLTAVASLLIVLLFGAIATIVPYYFFNKVGLFRTITSIITIWMGVLFLLVLISPQTYKKKGFTIGPIIMTIILVLLFAWFSYLLLR